MATQFTTYRTNDLLDAVTDAAYDRASAQVDDPRWRKAIARGFNQFLEADTIEFDVTTGTLRIESLETPGLFYEATGGRCQCEAFQYKDPCLHRALARLLARAFEALALADAEADAEDMADAAAAGPITLTPHFLSRDAEVAALASCTMRCLRPTAILTALTPKTWPTCRPLRCSTMCLTTPPSMMRLPSPGATLARWPSPPNSDPAPSTVEGATC